MKSSLKKVYKRLTYKKESMYQHLDESCFPSPILSQYNGDLIITNSALFHIKLEIPLFYPKARVSVSYN